MARIILFCICLLVLTLTSCSGSDDDTSPDRTVPSPTVTATTMVELTVLPSATPTRPFTPTLTPTASSTPTITPTLETRVLEVTAVMPGVPGFISDPDAPDALPLDDWIRMESDHPNLEYVSGQWTEMWSWSAGQNEYRYSIDADATVRLAFEGAGVRVCYVAFWNGGIWEVVIDGQTVGTVDSYQAEAHFTCTDTFSVTSGAHTLLVRNTGQHNSSSSDNMFALDAVLIYQSNPSAIVTDNSALTPSSEPRPARRVELIQGPPSIQPTATDAPPAVMTVAVIIAYDENVNRAVDPAEGVRGIPVRIVDVATNRVLAQAFTDESGYARIQIQTNARINLVVPYFGQSWDISHRRGVNDSAFTLLLPAGNQPGLIP